MIAGAKEVYVKKKSEEEGLEFKGYREHRKKGNRTHLSALGGEIRGRQSRQYSLRGLLGRGGASKGVKKNCKR